MFCCCTQPNEGTAPIVEGVNALSTRPAPSLAPIAEPAPVSKPAQAPFLAPAQASTPGPAPAPELTAPAPAPPASLAPVPAAVVKQAREFEVSLDPHVGIDFDESEGKVVVINVSGEVGDPNGLEHADRILSADGATNAKDIMKRLTEGSPTKLRVWRPDEFEVNLKKAKGAKLGAIIVPSGGRTLLLKEVKKGIFEEHNAANPLQSVTAGDRIVEVNGLRGSSEKILAELGKSESLKVVISRGNVEK